MFQKFLRVIAPLMTTAMLGLLGSGLTGCGSKSGASVPTTTTPAVNPNPTASVQPPAIDNSGAAPTATQTVATVNPPKASVGQTPAIVKLVPPRVTAIAIDKTGSVGTSKIPSLMKEQVRYYAEETAKTGGEIRIGDICTDSDLPFATFYSPEPPTAPENPMPQKPTLETAGNPLNLGNKKAEYDKNMAIYQQREAAYQQEVADRDRLVKVKIDKFMAEIDGLLKKPAKCGATDIIGMMKRVDLYLSEPNPSWKQQPQKVAILITDGLETVKANPQPIDWKSKAEVVLVSSGGQAGILKPLLKKLQPFESIDGAFRYVLGH